jgi:hypothetical protein
MAKLPVNSDECDEGNDYKHDLERVVQPGEHGRATKHITIFRMACLPLAVLRAAQIGCVARAEQTRSALVQDARLKKLLVRLVQHKPKTLHNTCTGLAQP